MQSFEDLWLQYKKLNENETNNYSTACTTLSHVSETCDSTINDILNNYNQSVTKNEELQQKIQNDMTTLRNDVKSGMEKVILIFINF